MEMRNKATHISLTLLGAVGLICAALLFVGNREPSTVQAQSFEPFSRTFTINPSGSATYIPACTTTQNNCIPNFKQVGHQISTTFSTPPSAGCVSQLQGSNDNAHFFPLVSTNLGFTSVGIQSAAVTNGYFPYLRILVNSCNLIQTVTYVGFSTPIPNNSQSITAWQEISSITTIAEFVTPFLVNGMSCTNNSGSPAYLQLSFAHTIPPNLGSGFNFEVGIPAGEVYVFSGPPINSLATTNSLAATNFYAGAATDQSGSTAVSTPLDCNFQINPYGPYVLF